MADIFDRLTQQRRDEEDDIFTRMARAGAPSRGVISETARGLATGLTQTGTTTLESLGYLTGLEGLEEYGREATERAEEYFDPRGKAGAFAKGLGRVAGEIGTSVVGGGAVLKGVGATAKGAKALRGMSAAQRALAAGAAQVPIDVVQGAKEEEGIFLPGRAGAIAESVGLGGLGSLYTARKLRLPAETRPDRLLASKSVGIEPGQLDDLPGPAIPMGGVRVPETRAERLLPDVSETTRRIEETYAGGLGPAIPMPADAMDLRRLPQEATPEDVAAYIAQRGSREALRQRGRIPSLSGRTARRPEAQRAREAVEERAAIEAGEVIGKAFEGRLPQSLRRFSDEDLRATFNEWDRKVQETAMTANAMDETAQINFGEQMTRPMGYRRAKELFGEAEEARQYKNFSEEQAGLMEELNITPRDIRAMNAANRRLPGLERQRDRILAEMERRGLSLVDESTEFRFGANAPADEGFAVFDIGGVAGRGFRQALRDPVVGALTGGLTGAATAEEGDRADMFGRAVLGAAAGAGLGRVVTQPKKFFQGLTDARSAFEKGLAEGTVGVRKKLRKDEDLFNRSLQQLDPTGRELWREEQKVLEQAGVTRRRVSDREIKELAKKINADDIVAEDLRKLDTVQIAALGNRIVEDRALSSDITRQLDQSGLSNEQVTRLTEAREAAFNRLLGYDRIYNGAANEAGRAMRMLGRQMLDEGKVDFLQALRLAKRALDMRRGDELSETAINAIKGIFTDTSMVSDKQRAEALAKMLDEMRKSTPLDLLLDVRRWSLLSAPFSWATNVVGSLAGTAETAIANPMAAALDNAYVTLNRKFLGRELRRTVAFGERGKAYGKRFMEVLPTIADSKWYKGIDPENPLDTLNKARVNYIGALGLGEKEGEAAWRASLRGGAKILQAAGDTIYGIMTSTDAPFYEAALAAARKERATVRAMNEFGKEAWGSAPFVARVKELLNPQNGFAVDEAAAVAEALDATFKTPTAIARQIRQAGALGTFVAPFANTPTNLIRRGLESIPVLGYYPAKRQAKNLAETLRVKVPGISEAEIADEIRRYKTKVIGRQLTTGIGSIFAGYALAKAGMLTQEYVEPKNATPEEREEMKRRQLTGQAPLTLKIGDTAYSLAPFATLIPGVAIGAAIADVAKDDDIGFTGTVGRAAVRSVKSMGRTVADLPVLQGMESFTRLVSGQGRAADIGREAATFIPFSSAIAAAGRGMDEIGKRRPETAAEGFMERIPFLRERVAPEVGVFGETTPSAGLATTLFSPLRQQRVRTGGLYDVLQELDVSPAKAVKRTGETQATYAARRGGEGQNEMALLEDLLAGNPQAWKFVPPGAKRTFRADVKDGKVQEAWRGALKAALSSQRSEVTGYAKNQAERQARMEGFTRNSTAFKARVEQLMAGQP